MIWMMMNQEQPRSTKIKQDQKGLINVTEYQPRSIKINQDKQDQPRNINNIQKNSTPI